METRYRFETFGERHKPLRDSFTCGERELEEGFVFKSYSGKGGRAKTLDALAELGQVPFRAAPSARVPEDRSSPVFV